MIKKIPTKPSGQDLAAKNIILMLQAYIRWLGFTPAIHFYFLFDHINNRHYIYELT